MTVTVIDLGMSNVRSVINMLRKIGISATAESSPTNRSKKGLIVLPGVGTFDEGMRGLRKSGWGETLRTVAADGDQKVLGLCLGMQLLTDGSEEGHEPGLGIIPGQFVRFNPASFPDQSLKVPHMGWNSVRYTETAENFITETPANDRYYFVHSYHYSNHDDSYVVGRTTYGLEFASAIGLGQVLGLQFHPEKSHHFGMNLLRQVAGESSA